MKNKLTPDNPELIIIATGSEVYL